MQIRLSYASKYIDNHKYNLLEDLREILVKARTRNANQTICGVLYYAEGNFFQCLEGEESRVKELYQDICNDSRHRIVKYFGAHEINQSVFSQWSMKYVGINSTIKKFLVCEGIQSSNFEYLSENQLNTLIELLRRENSLSGDKVKNNRDYSHYF